MSSFDKEWAAVIRESGRSDQSAMVEAVLLVAELVGELVDQQRLMNMIAAKEAGISPARFAAWEKVAESGEQLLGGES